MFSDDVIQKVLSKLTSIIPFLYYIILLYIILAEPISEVQYFMSVLQVQEAVVLFRTPCTLSIVLPVKPSHLVFLTCFACSGLFLSIGYKRLNLAVRLLISFF